MHRVDTEAQLLLAAFPLLRQEMNPEEMTLITFKVSDAEETLVLRGGRSESVIFITVLHTCSGNKCVALTQ